MDSHNLAVCETLWENQRLSEGTFKRIKIPLVRRIYPQLIANKVVLVQPLLGPTGLVYYLRFRYSSNKGTQRVNRWKVQKRWKYENKAGRLASRASVDLQEAA